MKNYTQVYVKNSFEAAETYCKAFGAEITREFKNEDMLFVLTKVSVLHLLMITDKQSLNWKLQMMEARFSVLLVNLFTSLEKKEHGISLTKRFKLNNKIGR